MVKGDLSLSQKRNNSTTLRIMLKKIAKLILK
jgi:hypothetical protein